MEYLNMFDEFVYESNKKFDEYKKDNNLISWNTFHTLMGSMDMMDAGKIWKKYKSQISNSGGDKSIINKITKKYKKRIVKLGGRV